MGSSAIETARCRMLWKSLENWLTPEKTWGANNEDVLDGVATITGNSPAEIAQYIRAVNQRQAIPATSPLIFLRLPADNHHVNKESADGKIHLKRVEPRTFKNIGAFSPRFEAADLVGEKSKLLAGDRGAKPFHRGQHPTGGVRFGRPEQNDNSSRFEHSAKFPEGLHQLRGGEMLHYAEIPDSIDRCGLERKPANVGANARVKRSRDPRLRQSNSGKIESDKMPRPPGNCRRRLSGPAAHLEKNTFRGKVFVEEETDGRLENEAAHGARSQAEQRTRSSVAERKPVTVPFPSTECLRATVRRRTPGKA